MTTKIDFDVLVTASEAYPALEKAVIEAETRIDMGFRVFDPRTPVLSDRAKEIGETWVDLMVHKLDQGVRIKIALTDFDPVVRAKMHATSWKSFRVLAGIAEMSKNAHLLEAYVADHPARVGWAPRLVLWPKVMGQLNDTCAWIDGLDADRRADVLRSAPRLRDMLEDSGTTLRPIKKQVPEMSPVTHHQKLAVIDDKILYIGGLDMDYRRIDTAEHHGAASETWHDVHALIRDTGMARSARMHLDRFQAECAGDVSVRPPDGLLRTLSVSRQKNSTSLAPVVCDTSILDAHLKQISTAQDLIYMESQFFRDPVIAEALADRAQEVPDLGLIIVVPAAPKEVAFDGDEGLDMQYGEYLQAKCLRTLQEAFGERMFIGSPGQLTESADEGRGAIHGAPMIFIHSKVSVFDDTCAIISSANINGRSMRWDTELGFAVTDPAQVAHVRSRVMAPWLPDTDHGPFVRPTLDSVEVWRSLAVQNAATSPRSRQGFLLPYDLDVAESFGTPLPGVPGEMV